jgi:hypothetical protein
VAFLLLLLADYAFKEYSFSMFTVIESSVFIKYAQAIWSDEERVAFINWIAINPLAGDVIPGSGGCRKIRWSRRGIGKRSGSRVIYFNHLDAGKIYLMIVYTKSKFDNLPNEFLDQLKKEFNRA